MMDDLNDHIHKSIVDNNPLETYKDKVRMDFQKFKLHNEKHKNAIAEQNRLKEQVRRVE